MNNKEIAYQNTLDFMFKHRCHYCGCTPKNDEWAGENPNICIDCQNDGEDNDDIRTEDKRNN